MIKYNVEIGENSESSVCHCCGKESCVGHGFVYKESDAYAVYYAGWSTSHSEKKVTFALAIGEWGDDSVSNDRTCFGLEVYESGDEFLFRVIEPDESPWANTDLLGEMVSRSEALNHPLIREVFVITENIIREHMAIWEHLN